MKIVKKLFITACFGLLVFSGCSGTKNTGQAAGKADVSGELIIFHAGSLSVPFEQIIAAFKKEYPRVTVSKEIGGSRACARKITDLHKPCDILASADYAVIDSLLIPKHYADWNLKFATNEMSIVYSEKSREADSIDANNWYQVLAKKEVAYGRADPNADPCGYRALFTMQLAEKYYKQEGLAKKLAAKDTRYIRPKEVDLLALLEAGEIDYLFLYRSVAVQHNLKYLTLPDEINLKNPACEGLYKTVAVELTGTEPGTTMTQAGDSMVYSVTIPGTHTNLPAALAFIHFLMAKEKGLAIMEQNAQPGVVPAETGTYEQLPAELKQYAQPVRS